MTYANRDNLRLLVFSVILLFSITTLAQAASTTKKIDKNEDGFEEVTEFYKNDVIIREETDRNKDGKADYILLYKAGLPHRRKVDRDYDGIWETVYYYNSKGVRRRGETDKNGDGKPDYWRFFEPGQRILKEYDLNFDGKVDKRQLTSFQYHRATKMHRHLYVWYEGDKDFDGIIDKYRVRGEKEPNPNKLGQEMDTSYKTIADEDKANAARSGTEPVRGTAAVIERISDRLTLSQESRDGLNNDND
ncbi:MAG: hypothetical protein ACI9CF_001787 [Candidatus Omnitrophota bacterium]|jgi:hypothetical protein